jgi:hypothetical protein
MPKSTDYDEAMSAASQGKIHEWVLSFLRTSGNNPNLAEKIKKDGLYHIGPLNYPIEKIKNIIGPDKSYKFQENQSVLDERVDKMAEDINGGWQAPPLIATNFWSDGFELADGGHRQRALLQTGVEMYPTIFYFRNKTTMDSFVDRML